MKDLAAQWQERLDREGRVEFRQHLMTPALSLAVNLGVLVWLLRLLTTQGATYYRVIPLLLVLAMTGGSIWWLFHQVPWLVVVRDGVEVTRSRTIPFARISAIEVKSERLTVVHEPEPGLEPTRALVLTPKNQPTLVRELASWLLRLKGGQTAEIVTEKTSFNTRVYRVRDQA